MQHGSATRKLPCRGVVLNKENSFNRNTNPSFYRFVHHHSNKTTMERWSGRVALVTGASAGIGAAIAKALVKSGMKVVGAARRMEKMEAIANELKGEKGTFLPVRCDLTKDQDVYDLFKTMKDKYGGVDVCINNAGIDWYNRLLDGNPEDWRNITDVNVIALCLCTKLSVASMKERGVDDGHIINIASVLSHVVYTMSILNFYTGTKFAVKAITEGLRQELRQAKSHIRASMICPAYVETEIAQKAFKDEEKGKAFFGAYKCLQPEDIAASVLHVLGAPPHVEINDVIIRPLELNCP